MIIIQKIETIWTKKSRGFPGSQKRSEISELILKDLDNNYSDESTILQSITHNENCGFKPVYSEREINSNQMRQEQLELELKEKQLYIAYWGRNSRFGKAKKIGNLKPNSWLQFIVNERSPLYYTTGYNKWVYNIVFSKSKESLTSILINEPKFQLDLQTKLL